MWLLPSGSVVSSGRHMEGGKFNLRNPAVKRILQVHLN